MLCNFYDDFCFSAEWITLPGASDIPNCALQCYREFWYEASAGAPMLLRIAAESFYLLYLNGIFIGRGPVRGTCGINYFDAYDVRKFLRPGKNHIGVLLHSMNNRNNFNSHPAGCALLAELPGCLKTDENWKIRLLPGWRNTTRTFSFQHGYKVEYDFRQNDNCQWLLGEATQSWSNAVSFSSPVLERKRLSPRGIPSLPSNTATPALLKCAKVKTEPLKEAEDIAELLNRELWTEDAIFLPKLQNGVVEFCLPAENDAGVALIYDFGSPRIGFFSLTVTGENLHGIHLDVTYGEELWNKRVRARYPNPTYFFTDSYVLRGGINQVCHPFLMHGAKLLQLVFRRNGELSEAREQSIRVTGVQCEECRYPYAPDTHFRCSDPVLERIWDICCETMSACTTDIFMDCPWREHAFWINDLIIENRASMVMFGPSDVHRRAFELAFSQQYASGWIPAVAPTPTDFDKPPNILPATNFFLFFMLEEYLRESGDRSTIRRYLPNLLKILDAAEATADASGLIESPKYAWDFYDWAFELNWKMFINSRESMLNSLYVSAIKCYLRLCKETAVSCPEQANLEVRMARLAKALRVFLVQNKETGTVQLEDMVYAIDPVSDAKSPEKIRSELAHALALNSGLWQEKEREDFVRAILEHTLLEPELYLSGLVFQALTENNHPEEVLHRIRKHWGNVVRRGCTTLPEAAVYGFGREVFSESGSLCHGFATSPVIFLQEVLLGIRATKPGYEEFAFRPVSLDLDYASGKVYTPHGTILVSWEKKPEGVEATLQIPSGTTAVFPDGQKFKGGQVTFLFEQGERYGKEPNQCNGC